MSKELYIIDSFAVAFRAHYAFIKNPLTTADGQHTSAVFGYANTIFRLIQERKVDYLAIAKDTGGPNFRHELYDQYKANRKEMPEELKEQLPLLDELMEITGIPVLKQQGVEADDLMAALCLQADKEGFHSYMVTKDKDMMQIVNDNISLFHMEKAGVPHTVVDAQHVQDKFGVPPEKVRDLLALMGDAADNVPGVFKVGQKTAAKLLNDYGTVDGIYENIDKLKGKLKENLETYKDDAYLSQKLVSLKTDLTLQSSLEEMKFTGFDFDRMEDFLDRYELHSLKRHLPKLREALEDTDTTSVPEEPKEDDASYIKVDTPEALEAMVADLSRSKIIAVDTETDSLDFLNNKLCGICLSGAEDKGYYVVLNHKDSPKILGSIARRSLEPLFNDPSKLLVFHNVKFDLHVLTRAKYKITTPLADTMLASYVINSGGRGHSLDAQVLQRLGHTMVPIESLIGKGKKQISFAELTSEDAYKYSAEDAVYTLRLWGLLSQELKDDDLWDNYQNMEMPLVQVLQKMETRGICLDTNSLAEQSKSLGSRLEDLKNSVYKHAGQIFNIGSPKQLSEVLFEDMGLKTGKKTKTGFSTDAAVLEKLKGDHPIIEDIIEIRELDKLKGTYIDALPELINPTTERIHTSYNQTIAATGRLSSTHPNLQNIPIRSEHGRNIRSAFVVSDDSKVLLAADYSQIELRILAHLSEDENLRKAYIDGVDIHSQTAAAVFDSPVELVDTNMRRNAKAINFGVIYGMSAFRLANELEIPRARAQDFIDGYFATYPNVTKFIDETVREARNDGYVETILGHRRYLPDLDADNGNVRQGAERMAVNTPIQGSAADLIKKAMIQLDAKLEESSLDIQMLLQVHDELIFEVPKDQVEEASKLIQNAMENAMSLSVPLTVEVGTGNNWLQAH